MIIGSTRLQTTVNLGSDALNEAFYNEVYDSNGNHMDQNARFFACRGE